MLTTAHAGLGWVFANTVRGDRRFRVMVFLAALVPDLDAVATAFSQTFYDRYHHVLAHNLLFSLIVSAIAVVLFLAFLLTLIRDSQHSQQRFTEKEIRDSGSLRRRGPGSLFFRGTGPPVR